jgi:pimeloyl-ACP methyl ester carboxylesterase
VLLHGLWMPALSMALLARRLREAGFVPEAHAWTPRREGVAATAARLAEEIGGPLPTLFVGHSLGGRLALALAARVATPPTRVVALGTPFAGSLAGQRLARVAPGRWLLRSATDDITGPWSDRVPAGCELGIVTGTRPIGLGRLVTGVTGPSDGTVRVDETHLDGASAQVAMPVTHMSMLASSAVAEAIAGFLREGKFPVKLHNL